MKFFQNIISRGPLILALTLILAFTGCVEMAEPSLDPDNTSDNQVFILNLSIVTSSNTPTRADHNDDYEEEGTEAENYIDIDNNDMRIILFTKAGNIIMELTDLHWEKSGTSSQQVYKMEEKQIPLPLVTEKQRALVEDIRTNGIQVMAIANTRNSGATTTQWTDPNLNLKSI